MKISAIHFLGDAELGDRLTQMAETIDGDPGSFGLDGSIASILVDSAKSFRLALEGLEYARIGAEGALLSKNRERELAIGNFAKYLKLVYATPTVSPSTITTLGLSPRSTRKTEILPSTPKDLIATPFANGTAKVKWQRGANQYGVIYQLESRTLETGEWTLLASTTKTSAVVNGMTPGRARLFRVRALKTR